MHVVSTWQGVTRAHTSSMYPPHQVDLAPDLAPEERADQAEKVCLDAGLVPKY